MSYGEGMQRTRVSVDISGNAQMYIYNNYYAADNNYYATILMW